MLFKLAFFGVALTAGGMGVALFFPSHSDVLSKISIEKLVSENSDWGLICAETDGHGPRVSGQSVGSTDSRMRRKEVITCRKVATSGFDEVAFLNALKAALEKEIRGQGAIVVPKENSAPSTILLEYTLGKMRGHIEIAGRDTGTTYYNLQASIAEREPR